MVLGFNEFQKKNNLKARERLLRSNIILMKLDYLPGNHNLKFVTSKIENTQQIYFLVEFYVLNILLIFSYLNISKFR